MCRLTVLVWMAAWWSVFGQAQTVIRINQLGFLPQAVKAAVLMSKENEVHLSSWELHDVLTDEVVWTSSQFERDLPYAAFRSVVRLDFSRFKTPGAYYISAAGAHSPPFRIAADVYDGTADFLLGYMRQQRCGFNPYLNDSCHTRDGYIIYNPARDSTFIDVVGGWHDASDYLRYVATSATAVFQMLFAYEENPECFGDSFRADGRPGANGIPDILDEARWGLDWLVKMNPAPTEMFNQVADDRDHMGFRLPTEDTISYGKGRERPVYYCSGRPQGLMQYKNRTTGIASTAGKFASAFALGALLIGPRDSAFASLLRTKALDAYAWGRSNPGASQTAPCRAPYFYEEDNWADDMELAATQVYRLTNDSLYLQEAIRYGTDEPVVPWMGTEGARHYQWYPFVNLGHAYLARGGGNPDAPRAIDWLREGIERVKRRGDTRPYRIGIPFIWCSNNLVSAVLTQLRVYAERASDTAYAAMEASLRDWLFGCNPWGTSMVVGLPGNGVCPRDPHSAFSHTRGYPINGGLVDGPVRRSIFSSLKGVQLSKADPFEEFQSDSCVYHDDWADYSTNEPTLDGTAGLTYYFSSLEKEGLRARPVLRLTQERGAITRMDSSAREIYLVFTGHEFHDGGTVIRKTLHKQHIKASFFFTGDFYRAPGTRSLIADLRRDGHYLGPHSDRHLLYAPWTNRDSLLLSREQFLQDLRSNYDAMRAHGIRKEEAQFFIPPFEWYNAQIAAWCREAGVRLICYTPGTRSNADYTVPGVDANYQSSDAILRAVLAFEASRPGALNGSILLVHIGTDPRRQDKFYRRLDGMITELKRRGYAFRSFGGSSAW